MVTPHVGVWIETQMQDVLGDEDAVTPHVGVWIETNVKDQMGRPYSVTPHVGVWIETPRSARTIQQPMSHLM